MACLTSAIEPLRAANEIVGWEAFEWIVVGEALDPVCSSARVNFDPDEALEEVSDFDYLFVLSGPMAEFNNPKAAYGKIRRLDRAGMNLGAFSGGVFPLTRSGVMAGKKCSVHWVYDAAFRAEFPEIEALSNVITVDSRRYTASGSAAVFDLMLRFVDNVLGPELMTEVACWFQHPVMRGEEVSQRIPANQSAQTGDMLPEKVKQAVRIFAENIEEPLQIADVAKAVAISSRQLDRSFQRATGQSPSKYYRTMRLQQARKMVLYTNDSMSEIAHAVGYSAPAPMVRHYRELFGQSPQEERRNTNRFRLEGNGAIPSV